VFYLFLNAKLLLAVMPKRSFIVTSWIARTHTGTMPPSVFFSQQQQPRNHRIPNVAGVAWFYGGLRSDKRLKDLRRSSERH